MGQQRAVGMRVEASNTSRHGPRGVSINDAASQNDKVRTLERAGNTSSILLQIDLTISRRLCASATCMLLSSLLSNPGAVLSQKLWVSTERTSSPSYFFFFFPFLLLLSAPDVA